MSTHWETVTIPANESVSDMFLLKPHGRIMGVVPVGEWDDADLGVDIGQDNEDAPTSWYPVIDGMTEGVRARIGAVKADCFHIICDFNHPFSDLNDEYIRLVSICASAKDVAKAEGDTKDINSVVTQTKERVLKVCVRSYE